MKAREIRDEERNRGHRERKSDGATLATTWASLDTIAIWTVLRRETVVFNS